MSQLKSFTSSLGISVIVVVLSVVAGSRAEGPKPSQALDLTQIRGFNYTPSTARNDVEFWRDYDEAQVERELDFARRLRLNQARIFLNYVVYERERDAFLKRMHHFVRAAHNRGIGTLVVVWDQCCVDDMPFYAAHEKKWYPNPGAPARETWEDAERWVRNQCAENQLTGIDWMDERDPEAFKFMEGGKFTEKPVQPWESTDVKRAVGGFAGWSLGEESIPST